MHLGLGIRSNSDRSEFKIKKLKNFLYTLKKSSRSCSLMCLVPQTNIIPTHGHRLMCNRCFSTYRPYPYNNNKNYVERSLITMACQGTMALFLLFVLKNVLNIYNLIISLLYTYKITQDLKWYVTFFDLSTMIPCPYL